MDTVKEKLLYQFGWVILPRSSGHSANKVNSKSEVNNENQKRRVSGTVFYKRYTSQLKGQVLERADRDGIPKVAQDLGIAEATLYA
jgi:hypothetical protein